MQSSKLLLEAPEKINNTMLFLRTSHSPFHHSGLVNPSIAYLLANPLEKVIECAKDDNIATMFKSDAKAGKTHSNSFMHVSEDDERFILCIDLPGVKTEDLTVELTNKGFLHIRGERKKPSQKPVSIDRQFLVDEKLVDFSKISATFLDGCLEIVAPKKEQIKPRSVPVEVGKPQATDASNNKNSIRKFDVDVPGIKAADLQVQVNEGEKLVITGKRKRGDSTSQICRAFTLDSNEVDIEKLKTFLEDGVLTVHVPVKAPREGRVLSLNVPVAQAKPTSIHVTDAGNKSKPKDDKNPKLDTTKAEASTNSKAPEKECAEGATKEIAHTMTHDKDKDQTAMDFELVPRANEEEKS